MKSVSSAGFLAALALSLSGSIACAQTSTTATISAPAPQLPHPQHETDGLVFAIANVRLAPNGRFVVEYAVQNVSKVRKYLILFGSNVASVDSGVVGNVDPSAIEGIAHCAMRQGLPDAEALQHCKKGDGENSNGGGKNIDNYTYIEPSDVAAASISYYVYASNDQAQLQQAKTANFSLRALVRDAKPSANSLSDSSSEDAAGPAHVLTVNFAFVPIQQPN